MAVLCAYWYYGLCVLSATKVPFLKECEEFSKKCLCSYYKNTLLQVIYCVLLFGWKVLWFVCRGLQKKPQVSKIASKQSEKTVLQFFSIAKTQFHKTFSGLWTWPVMTWLWRRSKAGSGMPGHSSHVAWWGTILPVMLTRSCGPTQLDDVMPPNDCRVCVV